MNCGSLNSAALSQAAGGVPAANTCDSAQRFSALVESTPPLQDVYVNVPGNPHGKSPVVEFLSQFGRREFSAHALENADQVTSGYAGANSGNPADEFKAASYEALQAQAEMLKTMMMMEMMSTAKQGVTTLFQQQG